MTGTKALSHKAKKHKRLPKPTAASSNTSEHSVCEVADPPEAPRAMKKKSSKHPLVTAHLTAL